MTKHFVVICNTGRGVCLARCFAQFLQKPYKEVLRTTASYIEQDCSWFYRLIKKYPELKSILGQQVGSCKLENNKNCVNGYADKLRKASNTNIDDVDNDKDLWATHFDIISLCVTFNLSAIIYKVTDNGDHVTWGTYRGCHPKYMSFVPGTKKKVSPEMRVWNGPDTIHIVRHNEHVELMIPL